MNLRTVALILILVAAAFSLSAALITHDGVGALEWIAGIAIVAGLLLVAGQKSRQALHRG
jgi:drug/metabolite transporter (DMT)-like permease